MFRSSVLFRFSLVLGLLLFCFGAKPAAAVPQDFGDRLVGSIDQPTALAFTPDGRMLATTKTGRLQVYRDGKLLGKALDISNKVCSSSERGLLGVTVDPNFQNNKYIYVYYTYNKFNQCPTQQPGNSKNPVNRVSRFVLNNNVASGERVLINNIPSPNGNHNAGDLHFGKDKYLYVSVGDGGCSYKNPDNCQYANNAARYRNVLLGKILRVERDGGIPSTNPYTDPDNTARCNAKGRTVSGKKCREIFATGLRNPFRMAFDPDASGTRFRINDVGGGAWEEIDNGKKGADYGWNICEGRHDNPNRRGAVNCLRSPFTPPVHEYNHDNTGCSSITGGAFVPNGFWPSSYDKAYLFGDYRCNKIFKLTPTSGGGVKRTVFAGGMGQGGPVHMAFGPSGSGKALYYTTFANGGEIRRIAHTAVNQAPVASIKATPTSGKDVPLEVTFDGSASKDPDGDTPLEYQWDFGDGTQSSTATTQSATTKHTYETAGTYTATLRVKDARGKLSAPVEVNIYPGNTAPVPEIESPTSDKLFRVGEEITLQGSATDAEDGPLADGKLSWQVIQHHNGNHTHPYSYGTGNGLILTGPSPEDGLRSVGQGNYLEIRLTATDSQGLSKTVTRRLDPRRIKMTFKSRPDNFRVKADGRSFRTTKTLTSWQGYKFDIHAPRQRDKYGRLWVFRSWSDGRGARHKISTPSEPITYVARFRRR